jgi:hypothetical protein
VAVLAELLEIRRRSRRCSTCLTNFPVRMGVGRGLCLVSVRSQKDRLAIIYVLGTHGHYKAISNVEPPFVCTAEGKK